MSRRSSRVYDRFRPFKIALITLLCLLLAAALTFTALFFGLRKYSAYDESGKLYLDIPWLAEYMRPGENGTTE